LFCNRASSATKARTQYWHERLVETSRASFRSLGIWLQYHWHFSCNPSRRLSMFLSRSCGSSRTAVSNECSRTITSDVSAFASRASRGQHILEPPIALLTEGRSCLAEEHAGRSAVCQVLSRTVVNLRVRQSEGVEPPCAS